MVDWFLNKETRRSWTSDRTGAKCDLYIGDGASALEIIVTARDERPRKDWLQRLYDDRRSGRINPIFVVVLRDDGETADVCGPAGEDPDVKRDVEPSKVKVVCEEALHQPNHHAAQRSLSSNLQKLDDELLGVHNQGLLSTHELKERVPDRSDWDDAVADARDVLDKQGRELVEGLGYKIEREDGQSYVLKDVSDGRETAIAVFLQNGESFEHRQNRFGDTPVSYALEKAEMKNLDYVIANSEETLRLYTTNPDAGFGSRGKTDTFVRVNTNLLPEENAGYLSLLFSADALRDDGSLHDIMEDSQDYATALGQRLRGRIYDDVIPDLAEAIAEARDLDDPTKDELDGTYRMALVKLYRLLFVAYAEDEEFLPRHNRAYEKRSLKSTAHELHDRIEDAEGEPEFDPNATNYWDEVMNLSESIHDGNTGMRLPKYNGRLLSSDPDISPEGAKLADIELTNDQFGPVLANLLIDENEDGEKGPVDFQNIGVREFGVIYEGLLESELSVADQPLTVEEDNYVPVDTDGQQPFGDDEEIVVEEDEVYLHGQSGERKATGSYYTDTKFVSHLLEHSLEPALEDHKERLDELRETEGRQAAADAFFDIRVADISMGSGHFLVSAVDRIETELTEYLNRDDVELPQVRRELDRLRDEAEAAFESEEAMPPVERSQLLRRQIARRCIYGVDVNDLATDLARLSLWVHTFVPGLPLAFLDYNLVTGDSLSGIGTLEEVEDLVDVEQYSLTSFVGGDPTEKMKEIEGKIEEFGRSADTDAKAVAEARKTREEIRDELEETRAAFDVLAASRIEDEIDTSVVTDDDTDVLDSTEYEIAQDVLADTDALHFPTAFPEVFMGDDGGFDVIVGNPPWEESILEEDEFWTRYEPGLQREESHGGNKEQRIEKLKEKRPDLAKQFNQQRKEQEKRREILKSGPFPGMGKGDPDTYKAFSWRFWTLIRDGGYMGAVLPRGVFLGAGSEDFRREILENGVVEDITFLKNNDRWVFDTVGVRFTVGLLGVRRTEPPTDATLPLRGPFADLQSFNKGVEKDPYHFGIDEALNWTGTALFPMLPADARSVEVFKRISSSARLDRDEPGEWRARPNRELDETNDKKKDDGTRVIHTTEEPPEEEYWPVFDGGSINPPDTQKWIMDTGDRFGWADPEVMRPYLQEKRENSYRYAGVRSAFYEMDEEWIHDATTLPCLSPRVAFRHVTQRTNQRTVLASLVPPNVFLTNAAPYFLWPRGDEKDQAYLLGVMNSIPFDWYARLFVEANMNYHILNSLRVPRPEEDLELRERVVELSGRLAAEDDRYEDWADAVGVDYGPIEEEKELDMVYELDAVVAHLYGLSRENLQVIFETFHDNWEHETRMKAVLEHYDQWEAKLE